MRIHSVEIHSDEEVKEVHRTHSRYLTSELSLSVIMIVAALYLMEPMMRIKYVGTPLFYLVIFSALLYAWRRWVMQRGTMLIITNQRVIDVDRRGFFEKVVSEAPYESLSDVSYRSKGLFEMLTNGGTITFQMIGGKENLSFNHLANPSLVQKTVMELRVQHARGTPNVTDPVEDVLNTVQHLSQTERRALIATMQQEKMKAAKLPRVTDATIAKVVGKRKKRDATPQ